MSRGLGSRAKEISQMGTKVRSIERSVTKEGTRIIARSQSNRGTRYIVGEITVYRAGLSKDEYQEAIQLGVETLME